MPFDTTYIITTNDENLSSKMIFPGGENITIELLPGQLPSSVDTALAHHDAFISEHQFSLVTQSKQYRPDPELIIFFLLVFAFIIYQFWRRSKVDDSYNEAVLPDKPKSKTRSALTYYGDELDLSEHELAAILTKRFPYYNLLSQAQQKIFVGRLQEFMADKTFRIHDERAFKEMPVLISAAAIQLTFGLKKFILPHFKYIHVHPQEFLRVQPVICFLEGNVSGHRINLSWKHFLQGYAVPDDGQNVGLHELAHALYYQTFIAEENVDHSFRDHYNSFNIDGNKAFNKERTVESGLYSEYAEKNSQEFWAESAELFFEKPAEMKSHYPQLYQTMRSLLNQDPVNNIFKVVL